MKKFNKSDVSEVLDKNKVLLVAVGVVVAPFIGISIYCGNASSLFIGGWVASLIISGIYYWFGITPTIKTISINSISLNKIAFNIAKQYIGVVGTNEEECKKQLNKNEAESKVVSMLFPRAKSCVEKFYQQFCNLSVKCQNNGPGISWSTFASFDSIINDECINAKKFKILQSKFKKEIMESVLLDLFVDSSIQY